MRKLLFLCALWCMASTTTAFAQQVQTNLFRLVTKDNIAGKKHAIVHNESNNKPIAVALDNDDTTFTFKGYLQGLIIYPENENNLGRVLITSAKNRKLYLKRPNSLNMQGTNTLSFEEVTDNNNVTAYTWEILYSGENTFIVSPSGVTQPMGVFVNNGELVLEVLKNTQNQSLGTGQAVNSKYKFDLQKVSNVF